MTVSLVENVLKWLSAFSFKNEVSKTLSPASIVTSKSLPDINYMSIAFRSYAMVYISTRNNMKRRNVLAIALTESNEWGGHYFMSLYTGKYTSINGRDDEVIYQVEQLAMEEKYGCLTNIPFLNVCGGRIYSS